MRSKGIVLAGVVMLAMGCTGCAQTAGTVAGNLVGGAAWAGSHGGKLAFKGTKLAAKTTGRTVKGAVNGVHEEFSRPQDQPQTTRSAALSQGESATLPY